MMNMLKSGLKAVEDGANTAVNVGKAAASGVVGSVKAAAEGSNVTLRLKQPHFTSGDVIEGWVDVDARIPLLAKGIDIRIQGYEKTEWHDRSERIAESGASQVGIPVFTRNRGKKVLFDTKIRVHEMNNSMLPAGHHSFPFKWQLPASLPGSFHVRVPLNDIPSSAEFKERDLVENWNDSDDEDANARASVFGTVHYKIQAVFDVVDALWMKDMKGKTSVTVRPRTDAAAPLAAESCVDIKGFCGKAGSVSVSARFDKAAYTVGETADVRAEVHNASSKPFKTTVSLQRTLTLRGNGGVERKVVDNQVQPQLLFQEFAAKTKTADCRMPLAFNGTVPSTAGALVSCSFEYQLTVGPTTVRIPVTLHQPDAPAQPASPNSPHAGAVAPMH